MKLASILSILRPRPLEVAEPANPGGAEDAYLLQNSTGGYLMEDNASTLLMESAP